MRLLSSLSIMVAPQHVDTIAPRHDVKRHSGVQETHGAGQSHVRAAYDQHLSLHAAQIMKVFARVQTATVDCVLKPRGGQLAMVNSTPWSLQTRGIDRPATPDADQDEPRGQRTDPSQTRADQVLRSLHFCPIYIHKRLGPAWQSVRRSGRSRVLATTSVPHRCTCVRSAHQSMAS